MTGTLHALIHDVECRHDSALATPEFPHTERGAVSQGFATGLCRHRSRTPSPRSYPRRRNKPKDDCQAFLMSLPLRDDDQESSSDQAPRSSMTYRRRLIEQPLNTSSTVHSNRAMT
jgi:hypothetical protein